MDKYNVELIEQKIFEIILSKVKHDFNNEEYLSFNVRELAEQLEIESNILQEYLPELSKNLLRRNIVINHDTGTCEKIGILISIKYSDNTDLILELHPQINSYLQYLTDNNL